jgi:RHS repeat-associated protein
MKLPIRSWQTTLTKLGLRVRQASKYVKGSKTTKRTLSAEPLESRLALAVEVTEDLGTLSLQEDASDQSLRLEDYFRSTRGLPLQFAIDSNSNTNLTTPSINESSLRVQLAANKEGNSTIQVRVTEVLAGLPLLGSAIVRPLQINVSAVNDLPTTTGLNPLIINEDATTQTINLANIFQDADTGQTASLTYAVSLIEASPLQNPISSASVTGTQITLSLAPDAFGFAEYAVTATDTAGAKTATTLWVVVQPVNDAPGKITIADDTIAVPYTRPVAFYPYRAYDLQRLFLDKEDGRGLSYSVSVSGAGVIGTPAIDSNGVMTIQYNAARGFQGDTTLTVTATDSAGATAVNSFKLSISNPSAESGGPYPNTDGPAITGLQPQPLGPPEVHVGIFPLGPAVDGLGTGQTTDVMLGLNNGYEENNIALVTRTVGPNLLTTYFERVNDITPNRVSNTKGDRVLTHKETNFNSSNPLLGSPEIWKMVREAEPDLQIANVFAWVDYNMPSTYSYPPWLYSWYWGNGSGTSGGTVKVDPTDPNNTVTDGGGGYGSGSGIGIGDPNNFNSPEGRYFSVEGTYSFTIPSHLKVWAPVALLYRGYRSVTTSGSAGGTPAPPPPPPPGPGGPESPDPPGTPPPNSSPTVATDDWIAERWVQVESGRTYRLNPYFLMRSLPIVIEGASAGTGGLSVTHSVSVDPDFAGVVPDQFTSINVLTGQLDVDIDSNNNNGLNQPDKNATEDKKEHLWREPGKYVPLNSVDADNDGIVDMFDGFNLDGEIRFRNNPEIEDKSADNQITATANANGFVPIVLTIPSWVDVSKAEIIFRYDASADFDGLTPSGGYYQTGTVYRAGANVASDGTRTITRGGLRIWKKDKFDSGRTVDDLVTPINTAWTDHTIENYADYAAYQGISTGGVQDPLVTSMYSGTYWDQYFRSGNHLWANAQTHPFADASTLGTVHNLSSFLDPNVWFPLGTNREVVLYVEGTRKGKFAIDVALDPDGTPRIVRDAEGNPVVQNGEIVFDRPDKYFGFGLRDVVDVSVVSTVTVFATDAIASEALTDKGVITVSRGLGDTEGNLAVYFALQGASSDVAKSLAADPRVNIARGDYLTAISNDPFTLVGSVTIPNGSSQVDILVTPTNDTLVEWDESVSIRLISLEEYRTYFDDPSKAGEVNSTLTAGSKPTPGNGSPAGRPETMTPAWGDYPFYAVGYSFMPAMFGQGRFLRRTDTPFYVVSTENNNAYASAIVTILDDDGIVSTGPKSAEISGPASNGNGIVNVAFTQADVSLDSIFDVHVPAYRADDNRRPSLYVEFELPPGTQAPNISVLEGVATIGGISAPKKTFDVSRLNQYLSANNTRRMRLAFEAPDSLLNKLATGAYEFDVKLNATVGGKPFEKTTRGVVHVINRESAEIGDTEFGKNWGLAPLQRLVLSDGSAPIRNATTASNQIDSTSRLVKLGAAPLQQAALVSGDNSLISYSLKKEGNGVTRTAKPNDTSAPANTSITITNQDAWVKGNGNNDKSLVTSSGLKNAQSTITWKFKQLDAGKTYQLVLKWEPGIGRASRVPITITGGRALGSGKQSTLVIVDQKTQGADGYSLGFFVPDASQASDGATLTIQISTQFPGENGQFVNGIISASSVTLLSDWTFTTPDGATSQLVYGNKLAERASGYFVSPGYQPQSGDFTVLQHDGSRIDFDKCGVKKQDIDRNDNRVVYAYADQDTDGLVDEIQTISHQGGLVWTYGYSGGILSSVTDFAGRTTNLIATDSQVREVFLPNPLDGTARPNWSFSYDSNGRLNAVQDPNRNLTSIAYPSPFVTRVTNADSTVQQNAIWQVASQAAFGSSNMVMSPGSGIIGNLAPRPSTEPADYLPQALTVFQDARGYIWNFQVDQFGLMTAKAAPATKSTMDPDTSLPLDVRIWKGWDVWRWQRDKNGRVLVDIQPKGGGGYDRNMDELPTAYKYDEFGNLLRIDYTSGAFEAWTYNTQFSVPLTHTDQLGFTTQFLPDARGNTQSIILPGSNFNPSSTNAFAYTAPPAALNQLPGGLVTAETVAAGTFDAVTTATTYYPAGMSVGLPMLVAHAFGTAVATTESYSYDGYRNPYTFTNALGKTTTTIYNALDQLLTVIEPDPETGAHGAPVTQYQYDRNGNLRFVSDPRGALTQYVYDARDRRRLEVLPIPGGSPDANQLPPTHEYFYDQLGNLIQDTIYVYADNSPSNLNRITQRVFDERNLLQTLTGPALNPIEDAAILAKLGRYESFSNEIEYRYDSLGNLRFETDPRKIVDATAAAIKTKYYYNNLNQLIRTVSPPSSTNWNAAGEDGHASPVRTFAYDAKGQLREERWTVGRGVIADANGNPIQYASRIYDYDALGRLHSEQQPTNDLGQTELVTYLYDLRGNQIAVTSSLGHDVSTVNWFDKQDRLIATDQPGANTLSSGTFSVMAYDAAGNLLRTMAAPGNVDSTTLMSDGTGGFSSTFGQVDTLANSLLSANTPVRLTASGYDALSRKISDVGIDPDGLGPVTAPVSTYLLDKNGNVLTLQTSYTINGVATVAQTDTEYDALGRAWRVIQPVDQHGNRAEVVNRFRRDGLLNGTSRKNVSSATGTTWADISFSYDGMGNLRSQFDATGNQTTTYRNALGQVIAQFDAHAYSGSWTFFDHDLLQRTERTRAPVITPDGEFWHIEDTRYFADGSLYSTTESTASTFLTLASPLCRTQYINDNLGRPLSTTNFDLTGVSPNSATIHSYDDAQRLESVIPADVIVSPTLALIPRTDSTLKQFDDLGRLTVETIVEGTVANRSTSYDAFGNVAQQVDREGRITKYDYDLAGNVVLERWYSPGAGAGANPLYTANYGYSTLGQLTSASSSDGMATSFGYSHGNVAQVDHTRPVVGGSAHVVLGYDRDALGLVQSRSVLVTPASGAGSQYETRYERDAAGRSVWISESGASASSKYVKLGFNQHELNSIKTYETATKPASEQDLNAFVAKTDYYYETDGRAKSAVFNQIDTMDVKYNARGSVDAVLFGDSRNRNYQFDGYNQETNVNSGSTTTLRQRFDDRGNQTGSPVRYDRPLDDATSRQAYDKDGNVVYREAYREVQSLNNLSQQNDQTQAGNQTNYLRTVTISNANAAIQSGWHRIRLDALTVNSQVTLSTVSLKVKLSDGQSSIDLKQISINVVGVSANNYELATPVVDVYVPWNHANQAISYEFTFSELPATASSPNVTIGGGLYLDRLARTFEYTWNHRYELTKVKVYTVPVTAFDNVPATPPSKTSLPYEDVNYTYDTLGNLASREVVPAPQTSAVADREFYIYENGHELLRLDGQGKLESHQLWADSVDRLLAVEEESGASNRILAWTYSDYQGTIRAAKSTSPSAVTATSKINYDDFGQALFSGAPGPNELQSIVRARQYGNTYDSESSLYFDGHRFYDPASGRLLSENEFAPDEVNPYLVAGNNPLRGSSQAIASRIGDSNLSYWDGFADEYWRQANPVAQWSKGNYSGAAVQSAAYAAAVVPAAIAAAITAPAWAPAALGWGATTLTGEYVAMQGAVSMLETQVEWQLASQMGSEFNPAAAFAKNFGVNVATGGIGAGAKWSSRAGAFLARQGIEIAGDTAVDVGVYRNDFGQSLAMNTLGSLGGEALGAAAKGGWRAFDRLSGKFTLDRSAVFTNMGGLASGLRRNSATDSVGVSLRINAPKILGQTGLSDTERMLLQKHYRIKANAIRRAAARGELEWSPGTSNVRIADLQAAHRANISLRYERMFGKRLDIDFLNADHPVDLIIGGGATQRLRMLNESINKSIGASLLQAGRKANLTPGQRITEIIFQGL